MRFSSILLARSFRNRGFAALAAVSLMLLPASCSWQAAADDEPTTVKALEEPAAEGAQETLPESESAATDSASADEQAVTFGNFNPLNRFERYVLLEKGTERASPGGYTSNKKEGTYLCKRCNAKLYNSGDKFESHCGWPSFDDEIEGAVARQIDADGVRVEILCKNCGGHLGHVFSGEGMTAKNTRHCVNSISMKFIPKGKKIPPMIKPIAQRTATTLESK